MRSSIGTRPHLEHIDRHRKLLLAVCTAAVLLLATAALLFGRYPKPGLLDPLQLSEDPLARTIVLNLRLPRIMTALIAGAVLGASGFVFQMLFSNPLVEPGFLGVSQGASFGAASAILFVGADALIIQISASFWALVGLFLSFMLAKRFHFGGWILRLVLSGIAVSAFFSAGLGLIKYAADPLSELQEITFWLLGGLWHVRWSQLLSILPVTLLSLVLLTTLRWRLNILSMDDRSSHSIGLAPRVEKPFLLICATLGTAAVISVSGLIGWVGLIVPHLSRRVFSSNASFSLPGSMIIGAGFMLVCDTLGRTLFTGELPLGIVTSLFGTVLFILLLSSSRNLGESV